MAVYKNSAPFGSIVTNGLVLNLDATNQASYPGSGTVWRDTSGYNRSGSLTNGPTFLQERGRGSIVFDGVDDYVTGSLNNTTIGSVSMWINSATLINSGSSGQTLIMLRYNDAPNTQFYIALGSVTILIDNEYITVLDASGLARTSVTDGGSLSANTWHNLTFNSESGLFKIYVNNVAKAITTYSGGVATLTNPNALTLGALINPTPSSFFNGKISNVLLYNRGLSTSELTQNYNALKSRFGL